MSTPFTMNKPPQEIQIIKFPLPSIECQQME